MDLNVLIGEDGIVDNQNTIKHKLNTCKSLGYETVAVSIIIDLSTSYTVPQPPDVKTIAPKNLTVYTRLTAKCTETIQLYKLTKSKEASKYDILALEPQNLKTLQYVTSGSAELDILTLNLSERLEFNLFKVSYTLLEKRGVCLEINYGPMQQGSSLLRNIICNGQNLTEKSKRSLILSSGLRDEFRIRSPKDVIVMGYLLLLPHNKCYDAVHKNAKKSIALAKQRKNPVSGVIELKN